MLKLRGLDQGQKTALLISECQRAIVDLNTPSVATLHNQVQQRGIPARRVGLNRDIINAVRFLTAPDSSYVTGTSVVVDGASSLSQPSDLGDSLNSAHSSLGVH